MREDNDLQIPIGCAIHRINRRRFLVDCAACAGASALLGAPRWLSAQAAGKGPRIRIVYALHGPKQEGPDWPNKGFDFVPVMERINAELTNRCRGFHFPALDGQRRRASPQHPGKR